MARKIHELSDVEVNKFIQNYQRLGQISGGVYALHELKLEQLRRAKSPKSPREVYRFVVESASQSNDGKTKRSRRSKNSPLPPFSTNRAWEKRRLASTWPSNGCATMMSMQFCSSPNEP